MKLAFPSILSSRRVAISTEHASGGPGASPAEVDEQMCKLWRVENAAASRPAPMSCEPLRRPP